MHFNYCKSPFFHFCHTPETGVWCEYQEYLFCCMPYSMTFSIRTFKVWHKSVFHKDRSLFNHAKTYCKQKITTLNSPQCTAKPFNTFIDVVKKHGKGTAKLNLHRVTHILKLWSNRKNYAGPMSNHAKVMSIKVICDMEMCNTKIGNVLWIKGLTVCYRTIVTLKTELTVNCHKNNLKIIIYCNVTL